MMISAVTESFSMLRKRTYGIFNSMATGLELRFVLKSFQEEMTLVSGI